MINVPVLANPSKAITQQILKQSDPVDSLFVKHEPLGNTEMEVGHMRSDRYDAALTVPTGSNVEYTGSRVERIVCATTRR